MGVAEALMAVTLAVTAERVDVAAIVVRVGLGVPEANGLGITVRSRCGDTVGA